MAMTTENPPSSRPSPQPSPVRPPARFSIFNAVQTILSVAVVVATLLTLWTPSNLFSDRLVKEMLMVAAQTQQPTLGAEGSVSLSPTPNQRLPIAIVSGHWGNDPGTVCDDGLTEEEVNLRIATIVQNRLISEGYQVDLLKEQDERLNLYYGLALISIHNDSCQYVNDQATGYKVAAAQATVYPEKANRLAACLIDRYGRLTGMSYHENTVTEDMTDYHAFREIHSDTPAVIVETGFLNLDRQILTEQPDLIAEGVVQGILCYVRNESVNLAAEQAPAP